MGFFLSVFDCLIFPDVSNGNIPRTHMPLDQRFWATLPRVCSTRCLPHQNVLNLGLNEEPKSSSGREGLQRPVLTAIHRCSLLFSHFHKPVVGDHPILPIYSGRNQTYPFPTGVNFLLDLSIIVKADSTIQMAPNKKNLCPLLHLLGDPRFLSRPFFQHWLFAWNMQIFSLARPVLNIFTRILMPITSVKYRLWIMTNTFIQRFWSFSDYTSY